MQEITTVAQGAASLYGYVPGDLLHPLLIRVNGDSGDIHPVHGEFVNYAAIGI